MKLLVTGAPGVGKTTLIKNVCQELDNVAGFYTEEIRDNSNKRIGFDIVSLSDESKRAALARVNTSVKGPKVGQYTVITSDFETLALQCLSKEVLEKSRVIVIDEIGKMESFSNKFQSLVRKIFQVEEKLILATVPVKHDSLNLVKEIVNRSDVEIVEVTKSNRDELKTSLIERLLKC